MTKIPPRDPASSALTPAQYERGAVRPVSPAQPSPGADRRDQSEQVFSPAVIEAAAVAAAVARSAHGQDQQVQDSPMQAVALALAIIENGGKSDGSARLMGGLEHHYKTGLVDNVRLSAEHIGLMSDSMRRVVEPYAGKNLREVIASVGGEFAEHFAQRAAQMDLSKAAAVQRIASKRNGPIR